MIIVVKHGLYQFLIAIDQLFNVILSPFSMETWADETMSSRCGRLGHRYPYKAYKVIIDFLFSWHEKDHCVNAYEHELLRYQCPPEMRNCHDDLDFLNTSVKDIFPPIKWPDEK